MRETSRSRGRAGYAHRVPEFPVRYRSAETDSSRWYGFAFRDGDIVISTRSRTGTTWMQMICALLVFQTPDLPAPLAELSPWLDWLITPREQVWARLEAQRHRRIIKTHTPLDGIPIDQRATYIVIGRHPLDIAVSLYHQAGNLDHGRIRQLAGQSEPGQSEPGQSESGQSESGQPGSATAQQPPQLPLREWLLEWIESDDDAREQLDSLPGVMCHLADAWARRREPNVLLVHYNDLSADLEGEMRRLAGLLAITVPEQAWPVLVQAATFEHMRARAARLVPDPAGVIRDQQAFFRRGTPGSGGELLTSAELARYHERAALLASPALLGWLHSADIGSPAPSQARQLLAT